MAADGDHQAGTSDTAGIGLEAAQQLLAVGPHLTVLCREGFPPLVIADPSL